MPETASYNRVLVKLSGEALSGPGGFGVDSAQLARTVEELTALTKAGTQLAVVVGAGNLIRGRSLADDPDIQRTTADYMGMLATVMNALALRDSLVGHGASAVVMSAIPMPTICQPFNSRRAIKFMERGKVVIFAGGTGSPFFTTDTCAALRASEIGADALIKATQVEGVFDSDPKTNPEAKMFETLNYEQVLELKLGVMDLTAISLCMDNQMPIVVLAMATPGNLAAAVRGEKVGTTVGN